MTYECQPRSSWSCSERTRMLASKLSTRKSLLSRCSGESKPLCRAARCLAVNSASSSISNRNCFFLMPSICTLFPRSCLCSRSSLVSSGTIRQVLQPRVLLDRTMSAYTWSPTYSSRDPSPGAMPSSVCNSGAFPMENSKLYLFEFPH